MIKTIVYNCSLNDVEDPMVYAAQYIHEWENSEQGKWVKENAYEPPVWNVAYEIDKFGHSVRVRATLTPEKYTFWKLKYG